MFQLKIEQCMCDEVELLSEVLEGMGALSLTMTDRYDSPILEPDIGTTPLWSDVVIHALYANAHDAQMVSSFLSRTYPHLQVMLEGVPDKDWERECMVDFKPQQYGQRLWVCPSWHTPPDPEAVNLILDPGLAFGTGTHPTTSLCLTWLEQADLKQKRIIDYGCGSGILALAALKLGASHVDAVDLDEQALIATRHNAQSNQIPETVLTVSQPTVLKQPVDIVIANILLTPLLQLKHEFCQLLKPEGILVVSGVLNEQVEQLISAYQALFSHQATFTENEWSLIVFSRVC